MGALISGLLDLLQWLASTFAAFGSWLVDTVRAVAGFFLQALQWVINTLWNWGLEVVLWLVRGVFWLLGHILDAILSVLLVLARMLPQIPSQWTFFDQYVIPAFNIANQILPITEAIAIGSIWLTFYALMAAWRVITFIRGGR